MTERVARNWPRRLAQATLAAAAVALMAGCAKRDSIIVGSVPDDYRTSHPIVIAEKEKIVDIPVGSTDRGLSRVQRVAVDGFIAGYDRGAAPLVTVLVPHGSYNENAASLVAADMVARLHARGVPQGSILHQPYDARSYGASAPIRLAYLEMAAQTGPCGRWPEDMLESSTANKHWANFGCSYQNNLAAQIANPADLLGPRQPSEIDTARRSVSIDDYRLRPSDWSPEIDY
jgi:pilus assembly protein CpaD